MIKVIIADDEERICQLTKALVDWDSLGMEIAGIAHNGLEAVELVRLHNPQILITDIRMPGCSGLDLIQNVKKLIPTLEIIIISGYAHFEYAQKAIKYGVGNYLLKPINKSELNSTLEKLKTKIQDRQSAQEKTKRLVEKNKMDVTKLQKALVEKLMEQKEVDLSYEILENEYGLYFKPGVFQAFWVKVDEYMDNISKSGLTIVLDKISSLLERTLRPKCQELLIGQSNSSCVGILNYERKNQEDIRRLLKDCLNQLGAQRDIFGQITFSLSLGCAVKEPEQISDSMREAIIMIQERLVKGTGRILDRMPEPSAIHEQNFLEKYLRRIKHSIEVMSLEEADSIVDELRESVEKTKDVRGSELFELIYSCGTLFLSQIEIQERTQAGQIFHERCIQCSSQDGLFLQLKELQREYLSKLRQKHENDTERPIRMAKQYIQNHFSEQITLEEVSEVVGLSTAYFSVQFKKAEGEGFAKYLIHVRIEQAKILLRESNCSISEICKKVGYNDLKHFTHTFEKATGVKPSVYRKLYG